MCHPHKQECLVLLAMPKTAFGHLSPEIGDSGGMVVITEGTYAGIALQVGKITDQHEARI